MSPRGNRWTGILVLAVVGVVVSGCLGTGPVSVDRAAPTASQAPSSSLTGTGSARQPNIVLITTDDQNASDLRWMPRTRRVLGRSGLVFTQALSPQPLCCPARAEILTGQYAHNNGVRHNHGVYGGARRLDDASTFATWLSLSGYRTAFVGKYLNEYGSGSRRPQGWSIWDPMVSRIYSYFGTRFYRQEAGTSERHYSVDAVSDRTVEYIRRLSASGRPFLVWSSQVAPHAAPAGPNRWKAPVTGSTPTGHVGAAPSLRKPSFDVPGVPEPDLVGDRGSWTRGYVQHYFDQRIRSLRRVDVAVERIVDTLARLHELERTYIFFTSDNAYLLGEHGIIGKNVLYEEALRVPLVVRGPGVPPGRRSSVPVTLVDLAPTFADIARTQVTPARDGQSFLPLLRGGHLRWRDTQLVQTGTQRLAETLPGWGRRGVRTSRYTFELDAASGTRVLFDRARDPFELTDVAADPRYASVVAALARRTAALERCSGTTCAVSFGRLTDPRH